MKVIDEKGRLFGKINVIDFLAILFLLSLTPMFYFGYKIFTPKKRPQAPVASVPKTICETEMAFILTRLDSKTVELISVGDKEVDTNAEIIGEITSLYKPRPFIHEIDVGNGQKLAQEDHILKEIPATLRLKVELKDNVMYYKNKPIQVNSAIDFKSDKYLVQALLVPPGISSDTIKVKNEIKDILLPSLEQKINNLQLEVNNLKNKGEDREARLQ